MHSPRLVWEQAKPALRRSVRQTIWVDIRGSVAHRPGRIAGLRALAHYSMLTEPKWPAYAMSAADWKAATDAGVRELPEPES